MTHTFAVLPISPAAFDEIRKKLVEAGYEDQFCYDGAHGLLIDMHGIALTADD